MATSMIKIGQKEFKFKKDAIAHYKAILNSYNFGESLNNSDFEDVIDLLHYDYLNSLTEQDEIKSEQEHESAENNNDIGEEELYVEDIQVARVQFNTKCFEVFYSDKTSEYISYLMLINSKKYDPERLFYVACRNAVHTDIFAVKKAYFASHSVKGQVRCQETGILSTWSELAVDHRQPNTFSVIVDRFKEVSSPDLVSIEYTSNTQNQIIFKDENLSQSFRDYHREKANLRVIRKECNSRRSSMARVKKSSKDLRIS